MSRKNPREGDRVIIRLLSAKHVELNPQLSADDQEEILASDAVQFMTRLHLLAIGDERQDILLPEPEQEGPFKQILTLPVALPVGLYQFITLWSRYDVPATFDSYIIETDTGNPDTARFVTVTAAVDCCKVLKSSDISAIAEPFYRKRLAAAALLETLGAICSKPDYLANPETLAIQRCSGNNIVSDLMEYIADGKLIACPVCGCPVLLPRKTSTPFCMKQHQVRYHERAQRMLKKGASVDDVASAFPYIARETINSWQNW